MQYYYIQFASFLHYKNKKRTNWQFHPLKKLYLHESKQQNQRYVSRSSSKDSQSVGRMLIKFAYSKTCQLHFFVTFHKSNTTFFYVKAIDRLHISEWLPVSILARICPTYVSWQLQFHLWFFLFREQQSRITWIIENRFSLNKIFILETLHM